MSQGLTPLLVAAALVLCVSGVAKLRAPSGAAHALGVLGLPSDLAWVRLLAALELLVGIACLVAPSGPAAAALATLYGSFAVVALVLARRQAVCGCFGEAVPGQAAPASAGHAGVNGLLAAVGALSIVKVPHDAGWLIARPAVAAGTVALAYAVVLLYTELPRAWSAWGPA